MKLTAPGFVDFKPKDEGGYFSLKAEGLYLGGAEGKIDDIDAHVKVDCKKINFDSW